MQQWLLYCLDDRGRVTAVEKLAPMPKADLRQAAAAKLETVASIEVWDGAICILRLHRGVGEDRAT